MRFPASEKLEIIRLVEQSHTSARRTLKIVPYQAVDVLSLVMIGYRSSGPEALEASRQARSGMQPHPR